ncbi:MAG: DUF3619 family protein [Rudaea sp.]
MTDPESEFARKLTRCLDRGVADMPAGTLYRLQQAREAALAAIPERIPEPELVAAGVAGYRRAPRRPGAIRWLGLALLLAAAGLGYHQWHAVQEVREFEEIDLHLLASDLPIDAYLDRGFQNWLRTSFER